LLSRSRRSGSITLWVAVGSLALLLIYALAIQRAVLRHRQLELQITADAAALAGAQATVTDLLLREPLPQTDVLARARTRAQLYAQFNLVQGQPTTLDDNPCNDPEGELVLGGLDNAFSKAFNADLTRTWDLHNPCINAVRVRLQRQGVAAQATAFVDRDVIGFRIQGSQTVPLARDAFDFDGVASSQLAALPLVPLAILTATPNTAAYAASWDFNIIDPVGPRLDNFKLHRNEKTNLMEVVSGQDTIREMTVVFSVAGADGNDNGQVLSLGRINNAGPTVLGAVSQITTGISQAHLPAPYNSQLTLGSIYDSSLPTPSTPNELYVSRLPPEASDLDALATALTNLKGRRRVWPLYQSAATGPVNPVKIVGFVAARVLQVSQPAAGQVAVVLQPTMILTSTALTDYTRRTLGARTIYNPYVGKVRMVE
jgi:hypothetical protein